MVCACEWFACLCVCVCYYWFVESSNKTSKQRRTYYRYACLSRLRTPQKTRTTNALCRREREREKSVGRSGSLSVDRPADRCRKTNEIKQESTWSNYVWQYETLLFVSLMFCIQLLCCCCCCRHLVCFNYKAFKNINETIFSPRPSFSSKCGKHVCVF